MEKYSHYHTFSSTTKNAKINTLFFFMIAIINIKIIKSANLICNGDFEAYKVLTSDTDSKLKPMFYTTVDNNSSCWYSTKGSTV